MYMQSNQRIQVIQDNRMFAQNNRNSLRVTKKKKLKKCMSDRRDITKLESHDHQENSSPAPVFLVAKFS